MGADAVTKVSDPSTAVRCKHSVPGGLTGPSERAEVLVWHAWTRCQSLANPSSELYSHIGETPIRLDRLTERSARGSKRWGTPPELIAAGDSGHPVVGGLTGEDRVHVVQRPEAHRLAGLDG